MTNKLPTFEDCVRIVNQNDSFVHKVDEIDSFRVHQFNYLLASYSDFADPCGDGSLRADELRGIAFVEHPDGVMQRYLMLHKFFNLNQTAGYLIDDLRTKPVVRLQDKVDGSVIRFLRLPNGATKAKSKFSLTSDQAQAAQNLYNTNAALRSYVDRTLDDGIAAIFELVGPWNQIVVRYPETQLRLLQLRDEQTGKYLPFDPVELEQALPWVCALEHPVQTIEEIAARCQVEEDHEGYIVQFEDGQICKVKTVWYMRLHRLLTENINREDYVVAAILDSVIDDALAQVPLDHVEIRTWITDVTNAVVHWTNQRAREIYALVSSQYKGDRKAFVLANKAHPFFTELMRLIDRGGSLEAAEELIKNRVRNECRTLERARAWLQAECGAECGAVNPSRLIAE